MYPIFGLVGPSGSGKTTIILELLKQFPDQLAVIKSLTTRPRRGPEDDVFYDFISPKEMEQKKSAGLLFSISEYAGNAYAFDYKKTTEIVQKKCGIQALVESSFKQIRSAGFELNIIKIIPKGEIDQRSKEREREDAERSAVLYTPALRVINAFEEDGLKTAVSTIAEYTNKILKTYLTNSK